MRYGKIPIAGLLASTLLVAACGCGSGAPPVESSTREATVKGTIKVRGKLVGGGNIIFQPSNPSRVVASRKAPIGKDGSYSVTTMVGQNNVIIESPEVMRAGLTTEMIQFDVKDGENVKDIELPQQQGNP
jgi:hypothetical protein